MVDNDSTIAIARRMHTRGNVVNIFVELLPVGKNPSAMTATAPISKNTATTNLVVGPKPKIPNLSMEGSARNSTAEHDPNVAAIDSHNVLVTKNRL